MPQRSRRVGVVGCEFLSGLVDFVTTLIDTLDAAAILQQKIDMVFFGSVRTVRPGLPELNQDRVALGRIRPKPTFQCWFHLQLPPSGKRELPGERECEPTDQRRVSMGQVFPSCRICNCIT